MRDSINRFLIVLLFMDLGSGSELWKDERTKFLKRFTDVYQELKSKDDKIDSFKTEVTELLVQHKDEVKQLLDMHETTESHENINDIIDSFKTEMTGLLVQHKNEVKQLLNVHNETTESHENISDIIDSFKTEMKDLLVQYKNEVKNEVQQEMKDWKNQGVNVLNQAPCIRIT